MRNTCMFACARYTYLLYQSSDPAENCFQVDPIVELDVLNTFESSRDRLSRSAAKCDTHCELLNIDTSPRVIASQVPSARVIITLYITKKYQWKRFFLCFFSCFFFSFFFFFFSFSRVLKICFWGLNCFTISCNISDLKNQFLEPSRSVPL